MEWASKETERRIKEAEEAKKRGEEPPDFEPINLETVGDDVTELTDADLHEKDDEEWAKTSKKEAAEEAELQAEHDKTVQELDRDMDLSALEGKMEQVELEAAEEAKRAEIQAEEQRQIEDARQKMKEEMQTAAYDIEVGDEASAIAKHEQLNEEVMSDVEMATRESLAAETLAKAERDRQAADEFNQPAGSRAEAGMAAIVKDGSDQPVDAEPSVIIDQDSPEAMVINAEEQLADIAAEMIDKRQQLQALEKKQASPDDASHVFKIEILKKELADLQSADQSLRESLGMEPTTETPKEEIAEAINKAGGLEFTTQEKVFFEQGEQMSQSNEHHIEVLSERLAAITAQYDALQAKTNQATSKKSFFGGLWSGLKNAVGRGDEQKLRKLAEQRDVLQEQLNSLQTEQDTEAVPEQPSEYQAIKMEVRKTRKMMDKMKGDR